LTVADIQPANGAVTILFDNGLAATLLAQHPDRDLIRRQAEISLRERQPVGVLVDGAGCLVDLNHTYQVTIREVRDMEDDARRVQVGCWGFGPVCYLMRQHPEFDRIRTILNEAAASGAPVRLANRTWVVEEETELWHQILDVRSLP
jgi:hypothetical protein